ncbi:MAG: AAA family ATPase [Armatimonadota bacterium]
MAITRLHVQGYRCLRDVDLELRPLTVLIGPNGSGKSSLLDVLLLLKQGLSGELGEALNERGGLGRLATYGREGPLAVELVCRHPLQPEAYSYSIGMQDTGYGAYEITAETLTHGDLEGEARCLIDRRQEPLLGPLAFLLGGPQGESPALNPAELLVPQKRPESGYWFLRLFDELELYAQLDVSPRSLVRAQQTLWPVVLPGAQGADLAAALYTTRTHFADWYARLEEALRATFPEFRKLDFPVVAAGEITLAWHQQGLPKALWPNQLSDGTVRYLWLCAILLSPGLPPVLMIDEPETSLHPKLLMLLAGLLREAATRTQIIVATQSAQLINWLKPEEVLVLDREDGEVTARRGDTFDLEEWLKEYTLGEAWVTGLMGGTP